MGEYKFPEGFKWGSATSAHQIEGGNHNDWTEWETSPARISELKKEGKDPDEFISGRACDSYNRYEGDFDIAKNLKQNIHRFSIEWSRIEPEEGKFDFEAMKHYQGLVKSLRERGIEPMVTLWHFTNPIWFARKGGFLNKKAPEYFTRYAKYVVDNLKSDVRLWITFNEASTVYSGLSYKLGIWPPQEKSLLKSLKVRRNFVKSHALAYRELKKLDGSALPPSRDSLPAMSHNISIGIVENNSFFDLNFLLKLAGLGKILNRIFNNYLFSKAFPYYDFIGLNYYTRRVFGKSAKEIIEPDMKWSFYPRGIYYRLLDLKRFKRPIFITENGWPFVSDDFQIGLIRENLFWVYKAIQRGVDIKGYLYWSLIDNFEWAFGYMKKFGLVEVDFKTLERRIRPSAFEYAKICETNNLIYDK